MAFKTKRQVCKKLQGMNTREESKVLKNVTYYNTRLFTCLTGFIFLLCHSPVRKIIHQCKVSSDEQSSCHTELSMIRPSAPPD